jgi:hypothetical protein
MRRWQDSPSCRQSRRFVQPSRGWQVRPWPRWQQHQRASRDCEVAHQRRGTAAGFLSRNSLSVGDPRVLLLDGLEEHTGMLESSAAVASLAETQAGRSERDSLGRVSSLRFVSHSSAITSSGARLGAVRARGVPCETHEHGSSTPIVVAGAHGPSQRRIARGGSWDRAHSGWLRMALMSERTRS